MDSCRYLKSLKYNVVAGADDHGILAYPVDRCLGRNGRAITTDPVIYNNEACVISVAFQICPCAGSLCSLCGVRASFAWFGQS